MQHVGCGVLLGLDVLFGVVGLAPSSDTKEFCRCPASLFTPSQFKPCFTGSSDSLGINPFVLGPLTRFSVPFWWRAGVRGCSSNELCFEAPAETSRKGSLTISASHYSISAFITALEFVYGAQDKLPAGELEGTPALHCSILPRDLHSRAGMRTQRKTETKTSLSHCRNSMAFFGESSSMAFGGVKTSVAVKAFTAQPSRAQWSFHSPHHIAEMFTLKLLLLLRLLCCS